MFVVSDSNANRAYGTSRGFQLRAVNAASSADACSSVSLQVWMVSGFTKIFPIVGACPRLRKPMSRDLKTKKLVPLLLNWFSKSARALPWRRTRDPYAIWVSEIMLQQTQVKTVIPFWNRWLRELPTIEAAAKAPSEKIHKLWEGLGYYTRVRNLQKAAQVIVEKHGGKFPGSFDEFLALPGIGRYTAGAICSIAFNQPT